MSHAFISYKSEDSQYLQMVVTLLKNAEIPFWADIELEAGLEWREEIDAALAESFAVLIIITDQSVQSHYVTYEWAWALGSGTPVIPLMFQDKTPTNVHPRLSTKEFIHCHPNIPEETIISTLKSHQKLSSLARYTEGSLMKELLPLRVLMRTAISIKSDYFTDDSIESELKFKILWAAFQELMDIINYKLPKFWIASSHAFTAKQRKKFEELVTRLETFYDLMDIWDGRNKMRFVDAFGEYFVTNDTDIVKFWTIIIDPILNLLPNLTNSYEIYSALLDLIALQNWKKKHRVATSKLVSSPLNVALIAIQHNLNENQFKLLVDFMEKITGVAYEEPSTILNSDNWR